MDFNTEAGIRIRLVREMNHLTREQLAELAEISPKFLYEIETGKKGFSAYTLYRIAEGLSVSADFILTGTESGIGTDKALLVLERFEEKQKSKVERLLEIVYDMCT